MGGTTTGVAGALGVCCFSTSVMGTSSFSVVESSSAFRRRTRRLTRLTGHIIDETILEMALKALPIGRNVVPTTRTTKLMIISTGRSGVNRKITAHGRQAMAQTMQIPH